MKLSISNIGWSKENDTDIYKIMNRYDYKGLEIAPTRIFVEEPYKKIEEVKEWKRLLKKEYDFSISSMQSIWFGRKESLFGTEAEKRILVDYTKAAIDFASAIDCKNLVFGCPKNRNIPLGGNSDEAIAFFKEVGDYAASVGTVIGMEANPTIYNTNYINDTKSAIELIKKVNSKGFLLNLDIGTMIYNEESVLELEGNVELINHVHISEPELKIIKERELHREIIQILKKENYEGYISIEMAKTENISLIGNTIEYLRRILNDEGRESVKK